MSWPAVRDAFVAAIATASGLDAQHVVWAYQRATQPTGPYISLSLSVLSNPGQDGIVATTDLTRPAGQEIQLAVIGFREATLDLEIFSDVVVSANGSADPIEIGENVRAALALPTLRETAAVAGISFLGDSPVQYLPEIVAVDFRGRATLDIQCFVPAAAAVEYTGYVASVTGAVTVHGGTPDPTTVPFST